MSQRAETACEGAGRGLGERQEVGREGEEMIDYEKKVVKKLRERGDREI